MKKNKGRNPLVSRVVVIAGLVLSVCGFYLDRAENFPAIEAIVAPQYSGAKEAMRTLEGSGVLVPGDSGFAALEPLVLRQIATEEPVAVFQRVTRMELVVQGLVIGRTQRKNAQTKITLSGHLGSRYVDLVPIMEELEESARDRFLLLSQVMFWGGVVIVCVGTFL